MMKGELIRKCKSPCKLSVNHDSTAYDIGIDANPLSKKDGLFEDKQIKMTQRNTFLKNKRLNLEKAEDVEEKK